MPHVNHSTISPADEVKVYQDEGEDEEEQKSSAENLKEVKTSLVTEGEEKSVLQIPLASYPKSVQPLSDERSALPPAGRRYDYLSQTPFGFMYAHPNAAALSMVNRVPLVPSNHAPLSLVQMYNADFQPPPAHIGISSVQVDPKTRIRTPVNTLHLANQFHHHMFSPELTHQFPWPHHSLYSLSPDFHSSPYHHPFPSSNHLATKFPSPNLTPHHTVILPTFSQSAAVGPKLQLSNLQDSQQLPSLAPHNSVTSQNSDNQYERSESKEMKKSHIKKPLNAFMLFMKEQRSQVIAECTLKESAAINQLLGKKWHTLSREEQAKYYELAKKERQTHMQMYPGWTARDNYAINAKKKKKRKDKSLETDANNPKKCRARYGLDRQSSWCKPCRRKKKCIRYIHGMGESEDNIESVDSTGSLEVPTPESRYDDHSDSDSGNGDVDSELSLSSPPVPGLCKGSVQFEDSVESPASQQPSELSVSADQILPLTSDAPLSAVS